VCRVNIKEEIEMKEQEESLSRQEEHETTEDSKVQHEGSDASNNDNTNLLNLTEPNRESIL
jgi:hypothetical protein